jgi:hypothetical protein
MPAPFLSYLRVYEPMRVFEGPSGEAVRAALDRGALPPESAGRRERDRCLRAMLSAKLLPPLETDVLVIRRGRADVFVCPLDTRPRAGAAVLGFLDTESSFLAAAALPVPESVARRAAQRAVAELGDGVAHVVAASWVVPLVWFALVDQDERQVNRRPRRVWWHVSMARARGRAVRAEGLMRAALDDEGPADVLAETAAWLSRFDRDSVVELDYGGLVDLFDEKDLRSDQSAAIVRGSLQALRDGDADTALRAYDRLRAFWAPVVSKQRCG